MNQEREDYDDPPPGLSAFWVWFGVVVVVATVAGWWTWKIISSLTADENR